MTWQVQDVSASAFIVSGVEGYKSNRRSSQTFSTLEPPEDRFLAKAKRLIKKKVSELCAFILKKRPAKTLMMHSRSNHSLPLFVEVQLIIFPG